MGVVYVSVRGWGCRIAGMGVEGDAHSGPTVKHRSRVKIDPGQPNLRQVHLIHQELLDVDGRYRELYDLQTRSAGGGEG